MENTSIKGLSSFSNPDVTKPLPAMQAIEDEITKTKISKKDNVRDNAERMLKDVLDSLEIGDKKESKERKHSSSGSSTGSDSSTGSSSSGSETDSGSSTGSGSSKKSHSSRGSIIGIDGVKIKKSGSGSRSGSGSGSSATDSDYSYGYGSDYSISGSGSESSSSRSSGRSRHHRKSRHNMIDEVMSNYQRRGHYSVDDIKVRDKKSILLNQIKDVISFLDEEGISYYDIKIPDQYSSIDDMEATLATLNHTYDRNRCADWTKDIIVSGSKFLEKSLDGTREIPLLGIKPNYTGFSSTVSAKMYRMRNLTSAAIGNTIESWELSPFSRILVELAPTFFMYTFLNNGETEKEKINKNMQNIRSNLDEINKI